MIEYLEEFNRLPKSWKREGGILENVEDLMPKEYRDTRNRLTSKYSFAVPTMEALELIAENTNPIILDYASGSGYWGYLLEKFFDKKVLCYDKYPPKEPWIHVDSIPKDTSGTMYFDMMLGWPPKNSGVGFNALNRFAGKTFVYIGEFLRGCGEFPFFDTWQQLDLHAYCRLPQWFNRSDGVYIFKNYSTENNVVTTLTNKN